MSEEEEEEGNEEKQSNKVAGGVSSVRPFPKRSRMTIDDMGIKQLPNGLCEGVRDEGMR